MLRLRTTISSLALVAAAAAAFATPASATEGYAAVGFGARHKALAGAGVADGRDATTASLNPAGLVHVGDEMSMSFSAFSPLRSFSTDAPGPFLGMVGEVESNKNLFFVPNLAWSTRKLANPLFDVAAFTMVGNGGMNTSYPAFANGGCGPNFNALGAGPFCSGAGGVNLLQMVMSVAMAKKIAPGISVGFAPMMALQAFEARGLEAFGLAGLSTDANNLDSGRNDWTYGFGLRGGIEIEPMKGFRIGVAGTTPIWMEEWGKYRGLFAEQGDFDIPASLHVGVAFDMTPNTTLMLDWRHIWYGSVDAVANPSANILQCFGGGGAGGAFPSSCLGGANGPGFGWKDVDVIKFGVEHRMHDKLTLRAGYAWNTQPIRKEDVHFNILAPAVTQHHITGGLEYNMGGGYHLELAGMYAPNVSVTGPNLFAPPGTQNITIEMWQYEVTAGIKYKFGEAAEPLK